MGLRPTARGLLIAPALPSNMPSARVGEFHFSGKSWAVTADRAATAPRIEGREILVPATGAWLLTPDGQLVENRE
jgi:hypothetical protein